MRKSLLVLAIVLLLPLGALADTLQIGPAGTTDPVLLYSNTSFTVYNNAGNQAKFDIDTLLLFFSVPTNLVGQFSTATANPSLTLIGSFSLPGTGCANVYDCAGNQFFSQTGINFTGWTDSNSFTNYTTHATENGLAAPSSYTVYLYSDGSISHRETVTFTDLMLPDGTYIAGGGLDNTGAKAFTAFTHAGLVTCTTNCTSTPEPASLALLGVGLLGLGGLIRRQK